jgi:two-component system, chemotaxis family, sensor kinase Cph1
MIQPYGVCLVLTPAPPYKILQVSLNAAAHLGISPEQLLGQSLDALLCEEGLSQWQACVAQMPVSGQYLRLTFQGHGDGFDAFLEPRELYWLLALEPTAAPAAMSRQLVEDYGFVQRTMGRLGQCATLVDCLQVGVEALQGITGCDRILAYRFDHQGSGVVLAETIGPGWTNGVTYLGLHFPATDIPEPTRHWYAQGGVRYIPDLGASQVGWLEQAPIEPPMDLGNCLLRGVDACCVQYHQSMGVAALMVIPLLHEQKLWGLLSCHHHAPKRIAYQVRALGQWLGQMVSMAVAGKMTQAELAYRQELSVLRTGVIYAIGAARSLKEALLKPGLDLAALTGSQGVAIGLGEEIDLVGQTPSLEAVRALIAWGQATIDTDCWAADALPHQYPAAQAWAETASGILWLRLSKAPANVIIWFRPEVLQTIRWAGNPYEVGGKVGLGDKSEGNQGESSQWLKPLAPRTSFAAWQETVRCTSQPWQAIELESALDLRGTLIGVVLYKADELVRLNQALATSNQELSDFAYAASHDLKEPLRGIYNYANFLIEDYVDRLDATGVGRLRTLLDLSQRMERLIDALLRFSQIGQLTLHRQRVDFNGLVQQVIHHFNISYPGGELTIEVQGVLPTLEADVILMREVFTNLLTNAYKYNTEAEKRVAIGYMEAGQTFYVRDNGIGIQEKHLNKIFKLFKRLHTQKQYGGGTGAGLTLVKKIVERHGGKIWVESVFGEGTTLFFTLG